MAQVDNVTFFSRFVSSFDKMCREQDSLWMLRDRTLNTKIIVLLLWKLVAGKNGYALVLNEFWCKSLEFLSLLNQPSSVAPSSFWEARKKLCNSFFLKLNALVNAMGESAITQRWLGHQIFCIDGTKVNLPRALLGRGFRKPSPNSHYPQGLVSCLFNLINKTPHFFLFTQNHNEIHAAKKLLPSLRKGDVIVYDRVFLSYEMIAFHLQRGLHAVFRTKASHTLAIVTDFLSQTHTNDCIVEFHCKGFGPTKVRLIRYIIKNKTYCLLTTLINQKHYTLKKIQDLYHARWGVEEFFKLSKNYLNLESFHAKTRRSVEQEIAAHFVMLNLVQTMAAIASAALNSSQMKQINRHHALNLILQNIEKLFLTAHELLIEQIAPWIFGIMERCWAKKREHRSYPRRSRKPINRWQKNINKEWARKNALVKASASIS